MTADETGQQALFLVDLKTGTPRKLVGDGEVEDFAVTRERIVFTRADLGGPTDLYSVPLRGGAMRRLTQVNRADLEARRMSAFEQFSFKGWNDETVYGYVMKPFGFEPGKRYPIAFLVHGGPQASMQNLWTYRWNAQAFAGAGLRGRHDRLPRLTRLRAGLHRLDQPATGAASRSLTCRRGSRPRSRATRGSTVSAPAHSALPTAAS